MAHRNIVLAGFMGTGKTTVGRLVAERLGWRFVDTDAIIEARSRAHHRADFRAGRRSRFPRSWKRRSARKWRRLPHQVIAVGGGALLNPAIRECVEAQSLIDLPDVRSGRDHPAGGRRSGAAPVRAGPRAVGAAARIARRPLRQPAPSRSIQLICTPEQTAEEVIRLWQQNR